MCTISTWITHAPIPSSRGSDICPVILKGKGAGATTHPAPRHTLGRSLFQHQRPRSGRVPRPSQHIAWMQVENRPCQSIHLGPMAWIPGSPWPGLGPEGVRCKLNPRTPLPPHPMPSYICGCTSETPGGCSNLGLGVGEPLGIRLWRGGVLVPGCLGPITQADPSKSLEGISMSLVYCRCGREMLLCSVGFTQAAAVWCFLLTAPGFVFLYRLC